MYKGPISTSSTALPEIPLTCLNTAEFKNTSSAFELVSQGCNPLFIAFSFIFLCHRHRPLEKRRRKEAKRYKSGIEGYNTYPSLLTVHTGRESDKGVFTEI